MIRPLRARHRRWIAVLAVLLPAGLAIALAARPAPPPAIELPAALAAPAPGAPGPAARPVAGWDDLWRGAELTTRISRAPDGSLRLDLEAGSAPAAPDLLVYWVPGAAPEPGAALPPGAVLLGTFTGSAYGLVLPPAAAAGGALLLYSVAHGEVAAAAGLPPTGGARAPETAP